MTSILDWWRARRVRGDFESLVAPHVDHLYRLAFRFTGQPAAAEDLLQDVLVKLYRIADQVARVEQPRPWMARVLYREYVDRWRRDRLGPVNFSDVGAPDAADDWLHNQPDAEADPERAAMDAQLREQLAAAMARLSEDHRTVLMFHDVEGYTLEELTTVLGLPLGTLKSRVHRARARLRELMIEADATFSAADACSMGK